MTKTMEALVALDHIFKEANYTDLASMAYDTLRDYITMTEKAIGGDHGL